MRKIVYGAGHLLGFLSTLPLIVVGLVILAEQHFGWRAILLFLMMALTNWAIMNQASLLDINSSIDELIQFSMEFPHIRLVPVPLSDYIAVLRSHVPRLRSWTDDRILPFAAKLGIRIRILVLPRNVSPLPAPWVTYANWLGAWIILPDTPDRLNGLGYFKLLHEVGHTAFSSFASRAGSNIGLRYMLLPGLWIALIVAPNWTQSMIVVVLACAWYAAATADQRFLRAGAPIYDEIAADLFALERCDPNWFPAHSSDQIVEHLSMIKHGDKPAPEWQLRQRRQALSQNLQRLRQGQPLQTLRELLPGSKWQRVGEVLLIALLVVCGRAHAPLTLVRLSIFAFATLFALVLALYLVILFRVTRDVADDCLGVKRLEPWELQMLERMTAIRQRFRK